MPVIRVLQTVFNRVAMGLTACALLLSPVWLQANEVVGWGRQVLPPVAERTPLLDLAAGDAFNLGLHLDGSVVAWGSNNHRESTVPDDLGIVSAIAAGARHGLALREDGAVVAWGDNRQHQTDVPEGLGEITAIDAGTLHSVALQADGRLHAWGSNEFGQTAVPVDLENVVAIAAGGYHNLALLRDGTVVGWGLNGDGQVSVPPDLENVVAIAAGGYHSLALRNDGSVVAWGNNDFGQTSVPDLRWPIIRIDAGEDHSLALLENGEIRVWGRNHLGQTDLPGSITGIRRIAAGANHNVVLETNGHPFAWGSNGSGQSLNEEDLRDVVALAACEDHTVALKSDGTVFSWGLAPDRSSGLDDLRDVVAVAAGRAHGLALQADGTVVAWGDNLYGQASPPAALTDAVAIAAGDFHSLALRNDGTVFAWGNDFQQQATVPSQLEKVIAIAAGQEHSAAVNYGGLIFVWGNNFYGQREVPAEIRDAVAIASGSFHNVVLRENGTLAAWGGNFFNQTEIPRGFSDIVALEAGQSHTIAIRENRTAITWGSNYYSQSEIPQGLGPIIDVATGGARTLVVTGDLLPPRISGGFDSALFPAGEDIFLMPRITGSPPFLYQWMKDGRPIPGETGPALSLRNVSADTSGTYSLILANPAGNIASQPFSIEVRDPAIQVRATPTVAVLGGSAMFRAEARGTGPFEFQWFKDGRRIPGATQPNLLFEIVREDDPGVYAVEVNNDIGSAMSAPIHFLIEPRILNQPPSAIAARIGERMTLTIEAAGSPPLQTQWFHQGNPIPGETASSLVLENVTMNDTGNYHAVVENPAGRVVGEPSQLEIVPHLTLQPESRIFSASGGTAVFEVRAIGTQPMTYRWFKNGTPFARTEDPRLILERVRPGDAGHYHVVVENPVGRVASERATLMLPPEIVDHPRSQTARAGGEIDLSVRAIGGEPLEYQWLKDGKAIPGANTPRLELDHVSGTDTARYSVMVSNPVGTVTSQEGTLTVSPEILRQPSNQILREGDTIRLTIEAEGSRPLYYQWTKDGVTLAETDDAVFSILNATAEDSGFYYVIVSNSAGIAISKTVEVQIKHP